jgi:hypothetical protein
MVHVERVQTQLATVSPGVRERESKIATVPKTPKTQSARLFKGARNCVQM